MDKNGSELVTVYFESSSHAEEVARFSSEEIYMTCLPALKALAEKSNMIVTESLDSPDCSGEEPDM